MEHIPKVIISLSDIRKQDPEINRILNLLKVPYVYRDIFNIFSESGCIVFNYRFHAQPYESAFLLHVSRLDGGTKRKVKPYHISFSLKELLDKAWLNNTKLPNRIKKTLDIIHAQFIEPKRNNFELALRGVKAETPLEYLTFIVSKTVKSRGIKKFYCRNQSIEVYSTECFNRCNMYKGYDKETDQIICKRSIKISKF